MGAPEDSASLSLEAFAFDLPEAQIALSPARPRGASRLLVIGADGTLADKSIADLPDFLNRGDMLLMNDSRVIPARLAAETLLGRSVELMVLKQNDTQSATALARPARLLPVGEKLRFAGSFTATITERQGGEVSFTLERGTLADLLAQCGQTPLPPYILKHRPLSPDDKEDYQTIYASHSGSIAAPTAGLHITRPLLDRLEAKGVGQAFSTLHVGAGTFLPVRVENPKTHTMHEEQGALSRTTADALNATHKAGGRICCVGTTSLRLLESASDEDGHIRAFTGASDLFIFPGYRFRAADILLTNFHLPRSTLFMLVAAFCGLKRIHKAYAHAIANLYRFYSYGDACLIFRPSSESK